ncbi:carboxypeptidase-like regulatory domain-containing protein [Marinifilum caeruleilacunae]|uniref:Carboxypeptidase-like regulatory domain-containing protein n=1 Tax=Marinifilum caeruleilacunae TaxID=2499076 RepID=A0ABX1WS51_9BACT|nr:carboxypeptidase-like regulatory domain-containing protein [Marinifilum caeruleilacunae]NOU58929.1 carboxypeptidase-like regulatory domain-containing protein [Marinifilum caeruleilacunae]
MPKLFLIAILLFTLPLNNVSAQNTSQTIRGKIIDSESKKALKNVEVFVSGTTIGTTTNKNGEFILHSPEIPCHVGVMHVAYQPKVLTINKSEEVEVELTKSVKSIGEVKIKGKNKRKQNLRMFKKYFLYYAENSQVKILNDSVLRFRKDEYDFHTFCTSPLIIENKHLGYQIKVLIKDFHVCKKDKVGGKKISINSFTDNALFKLEAFYYYQDMPVSSSITKTLIKSNRRKHYYGSLRHFLTSLYANNLVTNGYKLQCIPESGDKAIILSKTGENIKRYRFQSEKVKVTYCESFDHKPINLTSGVTAFTEWPTVFISLEKEFDVHPNGTSSNLSFEVHGAMGQRSLANTLPSNYIPEKNPAFNF